nr:MAG TPA: hypothetical protein [Caudoviricetes sp.]
MAKRKQIEAQIQERIRARGEGRKMLWDRLNADTDTAWDAFKKYRDAGLSRSVPKLAKELGKPRTTLATYSSKYSWVLRVAAWDAEQDRLDQLWMHEERKKAVKRHVRQAQALSNKWLQRLANLDPNDLSTGDVIRYADIATRMEREALGMSDQRVDVQVSGSVEARVETLSAEDTRIRLEVLQQEIEMRKLALEAKGSEDGSTEAVIDAEIVSE